MTPPLLAAGQLVATLTQTLRVIALAKSVLVAKAQCAGLGQAVGIAIVARQTFAAEPVDLALAGLEGPQAGLGQQLAIVR